MRVAIVGHEGAKFTQESEERARQVIRSLLARPEVEAVVSGACHLGGIDVWAEEEGRALGLAPHIYPPQVRSWRGRGGLDGFSERNLKIANDCDEAHCIVVAELPPGYAGMRFDGCYHCRGRRPPHVKSGGCWTLLRAAERNVPCSWHVL